MIQKKLYGGYIEVQRYTIHLLENTMNNFRIMPFIYLHLHTSEFEPILWLMGGLSDYHLGTLITMWSFALVMV